MNHSSQFRTKQIAESFTFPFALKSTTKEISLELLAIKTQKISWFKIKIDDTQRNLLSVSVPELCFSFNVYANGKVRVTHDFNHEAIHYFLDFFYHGFIEDCLVEK